MVPAEFLSHGTCLDLRIENCSVANGRMKKVSETVYSIPMPDSTVWAVHGDGSIDMGTIAKFADGSVYSGFVKNRYGSYSMPVLTTGHSGAFWVKD